jgi:GTP-binding protein Era
MKAGLVSLFGQPNVGKSTLVNALVGHKVSIVSSKPQTTRRRVLGIAQGEGYQIAFVDTPGLHEPHTRLGRVMVEQARTALADVDVFLIVVDVSRPPDDFERHIAEMVNGAAQGQSIPTIVCLNKMDLLKPEFVVENVEKFQALYPGSASMLTNAITGDNLSKLLEFVLALLPESEGLFPDDEFTDQTTRFMAAELIREKVLLSTRQEVPHATAVYVETWADRPDGVTEIHAIIVVEKSGQRAIILGKGGLAIKAIGMEARKDIEALLDKRVFLDLTVKVRDEWRMNPRMLRELEYTD